MNRLAWYHTSTQIDWPAATHLSPQEAHKALHVGTYEAATENILRRMRYQGDARSPFYLHRVTLAVDLSRINEGYRDENHEPAAQVTSAALQAEGLVAVRYLNVHEVVGSLSLALLPETIACVQTEHLPARTLAHQPSDSLISYLDQAQVSLDSLRLSAPDTSTIAPRELQMMKLGILPDPNGLGAASDLNEVAQCALWESITSRLIDEYFPDDSTVSPVVREDFEGAMTDWRFAQAPAVRQFADFFAASSIAVARPREVAALVASRTPRGVA